MMGEPPQPFSNHVRKAQRRRPFAVSLESRPPSWMDGKEGTISMDGGVEYLKSSAFPLKPTDALPHGPGVLGWIANVLTGRVSKTTQAPTSQLLFPAACKRTMKANLSSRAPFNTAQSPGLQLNFSVAADTIIHDWVARVHKPAYNDWRTLIDVGASAAWSSCLTLLLNPGESFITDAALGQARARGLFPVAVATDLDGLSAVDLERVLAGWDEKARGFKRPRVIYTQGGIQNPTGLIYDVAVRYDLIIVEDDPYYFQQASAPYGSSAARAKEQTDEEWLDNLVPSFLRFDYEGRVIRLDTFSKSMGPGVDRATWVLYRSPLLLEKLGAYHQAFISFPSGLSQAGFTRWLRGITAQYELRRTQLGNRCLYKALDVRPKDNWSRTLTVCTHDGQMTEKFTRTASLMSFLLGRVLIDPTLRISYRPNVDAIADGGVLFRRGELFAVEDDDERAKMGEEDAFLRASFSSGPKEDLEKGMNVFATVLVKFFQ
ncbi:pyridoxal phosphate-dependent transferase [Mycena leptocephala]|nr:pyridoxal phosphate-dependent transferase [Mycena leptocephala]